MTKKEKAELAELLKPFVEAKVYNPNKSPFMSTKRTINVKGTDIEKLKQYYATLGVI